jgi:gamma-glutamyltranspeptidase
MSSAQQYETVPAAAETPSGADAPPSSWRRRQLCYRPPPPCWSISHGVVFLAGALVAWIALLLNGSNFSSSPLAVRPHHGPCSSGDDGGDHDPPYLQRHDTAAIAADQPPCSALGRTMLQEYGGNAVDAAVVVGLCLGVVNPSSSGLGGGAFATIYMNGKENNATVLAALDCREQAPGAATADMFVNASSEYGGLATSVPGELHCYKEMHDKYGSLAWHDVVMMVVDFCEQDHGGPIVGEYLAETIASLAAICRHGNNSQHNLRCQTAHDSGYGQILTKSGDGNTDWTRPLQRGDKFHNPSLVATLRAIAQDGVSAFYESERTERMVQDMAGLGGLVTLDDMKNYRAKWRDPVVGKILDGNDFTVVSIPPPSSGGAAVIGTLRFLSLQASSSSSSSSSSGLAAFPETLAQHRLVEGWKHVFAMRMSLSDPDYNSETVEEAVDDLVESSYIADTLLSSGYYDEESVRHLAMYGGPKWALLNNDGGNSSSQEDQHEGDRTVRARARRRSRKLRDNKDDPFGYLNDGGTSHFCVVDQMGNAVSMTTSINTNFGSHVFSPSTGVLFSNTMDDFSMPGEVDHFGVHPSEANYIVPTKRPLSSMSPTLVFYKGDLLLAVGASGGPKIITAVSQVIMRHLLLGQPLDAAVAHARLHNQLMYHGSSVTNADNVLVDNAYSHLTLNVSAVTRQALLRRGQTLLDVDYTGAVQAIKVDRETGQLVAVCDPRKGGIPAGY